MSASAGAKLVEFLHLAFLQVLPTHVRPADYIVTGGANLRLFFGSRRRSQDIDLDYAGSGFWRVEERVDAALRSRAFRGLVSVAGFAVVDLTKPKQTDTTRRWKFAVQSGSARLHSKIEFSNRSARDREVALELARADVGRAAGIRAVKANHYLAPAAIRQKIHVLGGRRHTEPRDVFDLDFLVAAHTGALRHGDVPSPLAARAAHAARSIPYEAYRELVVDFLEEEFVAIYDRRDAWDEMVARVAGFLGQLQ